MLTKEQIDKILKCFTFKKQTLCCILEMNSSEIHIRPNEPWDIEWIDLATQDLKKFSLSWKLKGKDTPFFKSGLTFSEVMKILKFYKG